MSAYRVFFLALAVMLMNGCGEKYVVTGSGPVAKLRFTTNAEDLATLTRYDINSCPGKPQAQSVTSTSGSILVPGQTSTIQMIGTSGAAERRIREVLIGAGQPFVFRVEASRLSVAYVRGYSCKVSGGFVPIAGNEYEINFAMGDGACRNRVYRLSRGSGGQVVRTLETTQRYLRVFDQQDYCQWQPARSGVPEDIRAALEASEDSAPQGDSAPANTTPGGKSESAPSASDEPGSELREALAQSPDSSKTPAGTRSATASASDTTSPKPSVTATEINPKIPRTGDRWKYKLSDGERPVGTVVVEIVEARGDSVKERITREDTKGFQTERTLVAQFKPVQFQQVIVQPGGFQLAEISPYAPQLDGLKLGQQWSDIPISLQLVWFGKKSFLMQARVTGQETVRVPAGEFKTTVLEATTSENLGAAIVKITSRFWYAADAKRTVKMTLKIDYSVSVMNSSSETYELVAFEAAH